MTTGHVYTLKQAAKLTGVSHSTIRRRQDEGAFPNMFKDSDGIWKIPLSDLEQAGIRPRSSDRAQPVSTSSGKVTLTPGQTDAQTPDQPVTVGHDRADELAKENAELRLAVENWRSQAHQAERDVSELRGYVRGIETTLEESKNHNRELSARNRDLTQALIAIEAKVEPAQPVTVVGETVPAEQPAPPVTSEEYDRPTPTPEPATKRGWKFWK